MATGDNERIRKRIANDDEMYSDAFVSLSDIVADRKLFYLLSERKADQLDEAAKEILAYYGVKEPAGIPDFETDPFSRLDIYLKTAGFMKRDVRLEPGWYRDAAGVYIGILDGKTPVALLPGFEGYIFTDPASGKKVKIDKKNAGRIGAQALCIYEPLPRRALTWKDIAGYLERAVNTADILKILAFTVMITLTSLITPEIIRRLFEDVALQSSIRPLIAALVLLVLSRSSAILFDAGKTLAVSGVKMKMDQSFRAGVMMRMMELPADTVRKYRTGDLYSAVSEAGDICSGLPGALLSSVPAAVTGLLYLLQIRGFAPSLVLPAFAVTLLLFALSVMVIFAGNRVNEKQMAASLKENGFLMSMLSGIQKIRLSGADKRVFAKWAEVYKEKATANYKLPLVIKLNGLLRTLIVVAGAGVIYYCALSSGVSQTSYLAFTASYGLLTGAFSRLVWAVSELARIPSVLHMLSPVLSEEPEMKENGYYAGDISGKIDVNGVSFRYKKSQPLILKDFFLSVKAGEYIGIVGKSGCGKSTLLRILLGFEKPESGSVTYDEIDLRAYDLRSLRKNIGCVLQESGLFTDSIRANITVSAPDATEEQIWQALRMAGMEEDVRNMPMKLETMVSDDTGTISGGQKQRILIARALITAPKILFFDEATSALDNPTQKTVIDTLLSLKCTRIAVAHRLSTVKQCDRIILLEGGGIAEEGTYEELMKKNGKFAALVKRQMS